LRVYSFFILGLLLSFSGRAISADLCSELFLSEESLNQEIYVGDEVVSYKLEDYINLREKTVNFIDGNNIVEKTQILLQHDLPKERQSLVKALWELQFKSKYTRKSFVRKYLLEMLRVGEIVEDVKKTSDFEYTPQFIREYINPEMTRFKTNSVEVGAIIINLKSGRSLTGIHTSSAYGEINSKSINKAVKEILIKNKVIIDNITSIEYVHTHPLPGSLSFGDIQSAKSIQRYFSGFSDSTSNKIDVSISAIMNVDGALVINLYKVQN
jgi:hypothetical protein